MEESHQETDVWWGGFSPWTMLPSFIVCVLFTALIIWMTWTFLDRSYVRPAILAAAGLLWFLQLLRFCLAFFGNNYRLTTRRIIHDRGIFVKEMPSTYLYKVAAVEVVQTPIEQKLKVGRIVIRFLDPLAPPMVWKGVRRPEEVAQRIRTLVERAKDA